MDYAHQEYLRWMLIEFLGIFWLVAEVLILALVLAGRGYLMNPRLQWKPPIGRILTAGAASLLFLLSATYGRHWLFPPVHTLPAFDEQDIALVKILFRQQYHAHMIIWGAFVTGWVLLEALIVYHGWRGYLSLRRLLREGSASV